MSNVYNMRGVHGIFCVFVGMGLSYPLTDFLPGGEFLTDLKRICSKYETTVWYLKKKKEMFFLFLVFLCPI